MGFVRDVLEKNLFLVFATVATGLGTWYLAGNYSPLITSLFVSVAVFVSNYYSDNIKYDWTY
jgi:hypothetical protein